MLRCLSFAAGVTMSLRSLLAATLCLFTLSTAHAIEIVIDDPFSSGGGFIGASAGSSMSGVGIPFNTVVGTEADGTAHDPLACVSCFATFHTGATASTS